MGDKLEYIILRDPETGKEIKLRLNPPFYVRPYKPKTSDAGTSA